MKVICIKSNIDITKGKVYEVITKKLTTLGPVYTIIDDSGEVHNRLIDSFISLSLYRRRKIQEINESNLYK